MRQLTIVLKLFFSFCTKQNKNVTLMQFYRGGTNITEYTIFNIRNHHSHHYLKLKILS